MVIQLLRWSCAVGLLAVAAPSVAAEGIRVLVLPLQPLAGTTRDQAELVTSLITAEAARIPGVNVVAFREIEGTLSQDQLRSAAGCATASCAAEIAGALDTDEIVMGSMGR